MPFFSVIIPVYKAEPYLRKCVDSVLEQTFRDFELILVDDGSPDSCPAICDEYAGKDDRVQVIHKKNGGVSSARNAGIRAAVGEYLAFLDSDDYWCEPKGLQVIYDAVNARPIDILVFGVERIDAKTGKHAPRPYYPPELNEMSTPQILSLLLERNTLLSSFFEMAIRRDFLVGNLLYLDETLPTAEDGEWQMHSMCCSPHYGFINDAIYCTLRGTADVFRAARWDRLEAMCSFLEKYWAREYPSPELKGCVLGLGAYHYTLLCAQAASGERCARRAALLLRLRPLRGYWDYAKERKSLLAARVYRACGFRLTVALLGRYIKRKYG